MRECNQCGKCCEKYGGGGLSATKTEIAFWETFRPEIFKYVHEDEIWFSPTTGQRLNTCPWLRSIPNSNKTTCSIYDDRPDDCRHYPANIEEMLNDDCEMLEPRDLNQPQQAQRKLDLIMSDSRPPKQ